MRAWECGSRPAPTRSLGQIDECPATHVAKKAAIRWYQLINVFSSHAFN